jgi:ABC-type multidrug transport system fused ATPase/permease subunit
MDVGKRKGGRPDWNKKDINTRPAANGDRKITFDWLSKSQTQIGKVAESYNSDEAERLELTSVVFSYRPTFLQHFIGTKFETFVFFSNIFGFLPRPLCEQSQSDLTTSNYNTLTCLHWSQPAPAQAKPASLSWRAVSLVADGRNILSNIDGIARPGRMLAVMGPSGAGKTSLLKVHAQFL